MKWFIGMIVNETIILPGNCLVKVTFLPGSTVEGCLLSITKGSCLPLLLARFRVSVLITYGGM